MITYRCTYAFDPEEIVTFLFEVEEDTSLEDAIGEALLQIDSDQQPIAFSVLNVTATNPPHGEDDRT